MTRRLDESVTRRLDDSDTGPKEGRSPARPCSTHGATSTQIGRPCTHPRAILRGMGAVRLEPAGGGEGGEGRAAHNLSGFARILGPGGRPQSSAAARRRPPRAAGSLVVSPLGTARPCARAQHRSAPARVPYLPPRACLICRRACLICRRACLICRRRACLICRRARALFAVARVPLCRRARTAFAPAQHRSANPRACRICRRALAYLPPRACRFAGCAWTRLGRAAGTPAAGRVSGTPADSD